MTMAILAILGLFVVGNLVAFAAYKRSQKQPDEQDSAHFWHLIYDGLRAPALTSRKFVQEAYGSDFTLAKVILFTFIACFAILALLTEYGFLQIVFSLVLQETEDTPAIFAGLQASQLLAVFICACSGIAGYLAFDEGAEFWKKVIGWNILIITAGIEGYLGYTRGLEFSILGSLQSLLAGAPQAPNQNTGEFFPIANAVLGFLNPLLAALTFRYLLTWATWLVASCVGIALFAVMWFPTWLLSRLVLWKQRNLPASDTGIVQAGERPDDPGLNNSPDGQDHTALPDAATERAEEERQRLEELEEAEHRRREAATMNPFA